MDNKKIELTKSEKTIYNYLKKYINEHSYSPSIRELCSSTNFKSTSTIHKYLLSLEKKGYIIRKDSISRGISIIDDEENNEDILDNITQFPNSSYVNVPVIGEVTAGIPILAHENRVDTFPIPKHFAGNNSEVFMLKVKGDSMINAGILDEDYVLVNRINYASNRDIVVAMIDNEATVKTFFKEKDHIRLQPENDFYEPIICRDNVSILGRVIGVFRKL